MKSPLLRVMSSCAGSALLFLAVPAIGQTILIDHTQVDVSILSREQIAAARGLRMSFSHASVGSNVWDGLTSLAATNEAFTFPNWTDNARGNPGWEAKLTEFESWVEEHASEFDVFQNKLCYIDQDVDFPSYRDSMLRLAEQYPAHHFVWWTIPIMTSDASNSLRAEFNQAVRDACAEHDLPLFDLADIESHTVEGEAVTDAGVEAMDPEQSSDGGHLNELGSARAAAAQWVLMAELAGAEVPSGSGGPTAGDVEPSEESSDGDDSGCTVSPRRVAGSSWVLLVGSLLFGLGARRRGRA